MIWWVLSGIVTVAVVGWVVARDRQQELSHRAALMAATTALEAEQQAIEQLAQAAIETNAALASELSLLNEEFDLNRSAVSDTADKIHQQDEVLASALQVFERGFSKVVEESFPLTLLERRAGVLSLAGEMFVDPRQLAHLAIRSHPFKTLGISAATANLYWAPLFEEPSSQDSSSEEGARQGRDPDTKYGKSLRPLIAAAYC